MQHTVKKPQKPKEQEAKNNKSQKSQEAKQLIKQKPEKNTKAKKPDWKTKNSMQTSYNSPIRHMFWDNTI